MVRFCRDSLLNLKIGVEFEEKNLKKTSLTNSWACDFFSDQGTLLGRTGLQFWQCIRCNVIVVYIINWRRLASVSAFVMFFRHRRLPSHLLYGNNEEERCLWVVQLPTSLSSFVVARGKVCIRAKWPSRPVPISGISHGATWSISSLWVGC